MQSDRFKNILREVMLIHPTFHVVITLHNHSKVNRN